MNGTTNKLFFFDENNFKITSNLKVACDIIEENKIIYKKVLFPPKSSFHSLPVTSTFLYELKLVIEESGACPGYPYLDMDESCNLKFC